MESFSLSAERFGPLFEPPREATSWRDCKDPCPVFDGSQWHLYGSGGSVYDEVWVITHAVAHSPEGPWHPVGPIELQGIAGPHIAAPGIVWEDGVFHMFVQTDFMALGGTIEYATSHDGHVFVHQHTALTSVVHGEEAGLYDPHPSRVGGVPYLVYSGMSEVGRPDIYVARSQSGTWDGPWDRVGCILRHEHVPHHNQRDHLDYEWGLEGPQLVELAPGLVLLTAVSFLATGERGTRQRVFFAFAHDVPGPYVSLGPLLEPQGDWEGGENGHAAGFVMHDKLLLWYQARGRGEHHSWRYGLAQYRLEDVCQVGRQSLL